MNLFFRLRKSSSPSNWWSKDRVVPHPRLPRAPRPTPRARSLDRPRLSTFSSAIDIYEAPALQTPDNNCTYANVDIKETVENNLNKLPCLSPNQLKSRSYDDLLDKSDKVTSNSENFEPPSSYSQDEIIDDEEEPDVPATKNFTKSVEDQLDCLDEEPAEQVDVPRRAQSCEGLLNDSSASHQVSMLSLPLPFNSASGMKRKKNFMDKCVNKVRSLVLRK